MNTTLSSLLLALALTAPAIAQNPAADAATSRTEKAAADRAAAEKAALQKAEAQRSKIEGAASKSTTTTTTTTAVAPTAAAVTDAAGSEVGIAARDGITISGTDVMVTRNGVVSKLENVLELPNGIKVSPDGTFTSAAGEVIPLRVGQRMTFDGRLVESPVRETVTPVPAPALQPVVPNAATTPVTPARKGDGNQATVTGNMPNPAPKLGADGGAK